MCEPCAPIWPVLRVLAALRSGATRPVCGGPRIVTRDDWHDAFGHLTVSDLTIACRLARTVDHTYVCSRVLRMNYEDFPPISARTARTLAPARRAVYDLHQQILDRRRALRAAERTAEQIARDAAVRDAHDSVTERAARTAHRDRAEARLLERARNGSTLLPWERDQLAKIRGGA